MNIFIKSIAGILNFLLLRTFSIVGLINNIPSWHSYKKINCSVKEA